MSGLIVTSKAFFKQIEKKRKETIRAIQMCVDNGIDPGYTVDDMMASEIDRIKEEFRMQCRLAVELKKVAEEEGLIKSQVDNGTPKLEDSPVLGDRFALITMRPEPGTCLVWFEQSLCDLQHQPWIKCAEIHMEQTGTDQESLGEGFHAHMVCKVTRTKRAGDIAKDLVKHFEPSRVHIEIGNKKHKFLKTERDLEYALNYIRGDKHDEDKEDAVIMNEDWRKLHGLQDVYYIRDWDNRETRPDAVIIEEVN
jgi:hypothetical protein